MKITVNYIDTSEEANSKAASWLMQQFTDIESTMTLVQSCVLLEQELSEGKVEGFTAYNLGKVYDEVVLDYELNCQSNGEYLREVAAASRGNY